METRDIDFQVDTFDGKRHTIHAHKIGKTWKATASVDGKHVQGQGARTPEKAAANWVRAYKYAFDF